jgi:8-oxo-dGTP pyrophosphatase MutT (NUDIX family)
LETQEVIEWLKERLQQPLPGRPAQEKMVGRAVPTPEFVPEDAKQSAVLVLLFPKNGELYLALIKRREDNKHHSGQVSFAGGRYEPADKALINTALREAHEEIGTPLTGVNILGALTSLYIPVSKFNVSPFVGYIPEAPQFRIDENEVAYVIEVSLAALFDDSCKIVTDVISPGIKITVKNVHAYRLPDGNIIWGATAMILSELEILLKERTEG